MLMRGVYGELQPKAYIKKPFDRWYIQPLFIRNLPEQHIDGSEESAIRAMESLGFACRKIHDFRGDYYECIHTETDEAVKAEAEAKALEDQRWQSQAEKGFVRFGKSPKSGCSRNYRDNYNESGVSCYNALFLDGKYRLILSDTQKSQMYCYASGRDAYRLWGAVVGIGSDGEPLLKVEREELIH